MFNHPTAAELIAAARMHLEQQVIPTINEPRLRFQTLVAANVLAIVERELSSAGDFWADAWRRMAVLEGETGEPPFGMELVAAVEQQNRRLCERIRSGMYDSSSARRVLLAHLRRSAEEELRVANPRYLERVI